MMFNFPYSETLEMLRKDRLNHQRKLVPDQATFYPSDGIGHHEERAGPTVRVQ